MKQALLFIKKYMPNLLMHKIGKISFLLAFILLMMGGGAMGQTNPSAFDLSSGSFTFTTQTSTSTIYPTNIQGWTTGTNNIATLTTAAPGPDQSLVASGTITTSGLSNLGANGFNFLSTGSSPNQQVGALCLSLNATGRSNLLVSWSAYDGNASTSSRIMNLTLQYRLGNSGTFTTVPNSTYTTTGTATAAASTTFTNISLPSACDGQSIVQLRWIYYESASQSGSRHSIRLDDITVSSSPVSSGSNSPTLTAAASATVDAPFNVTFTDDASWRVAITSITVGGTTLSASAYTISSGQITFTPSASSLLQSSGTKSIVVIATGYNNATVSQVIGAGAPAKLAMLTQPTAPATNGAVLAVQPSVAIQDQYGNATTSTASVSAAVGAGTWTLGGTSSVAATSGTTSFSGLTATSAAAVTGATITFTSTGLTGVTSNTFNIVAPPPANDLCNNSISLSNGISSSGTSISATYTTLTSEPYTAYSDVWYVYTAINSGTVTVQCTNTASIDYDLFAYASTCPTVATGIGSTPTSSTTNETMTFTATAGTTYYIRVVNSTNTTGSAFTINVSQAIASPTLSSSSNITCSSFIVNWSSVTSATSYKLDVATSFLSLILNENFSGFITAAGTTDRSSALNSYTQTNGWTGAYIYENAGQIKLGTSSAIGYIITPSLNLSSNSGSATLSFDLQKYGTDNTSIQVLLSTNNGSSYTQIGSNITATSSITNYIVSLTGCTSTSKIKITASVASNNRYYLDNFKVSQDNYVSGYQDLSVSATSKSITGLSPNTKYYYRVRSTDGTNTSSNSSIDSITTSSVPSAPTATATQILCPGATVANLSATGTAIQWYDAASAGNLVPSATSVSNNTSYYATQTVNGCESSTRTAVTASLKNQWTGATSSSWSTAGNWSCGSVPVATDNILIATNSSNPTILDADFTVNASGTLTISGSGTLTINPGQKLTLTGAADFGGKLVTVASNASGSGAIVLNGGALTGATNVSLQQWFSAQRAWRMLSNPFTTAITAAAIATNNSSLSVNQSGTGDMVVYTSANDTWAANTTIAANSCYGFFYKGLQSDFNGTPGLSNYSGSGPTATTYTVNGTLNTGSVSVTPYASATYTLVGNPFAAPVNSIALTGGSAAPYYYYQASSASTDIKVKSGAWIAAATNSSNTTTIPMMGLIAYQAPNTNAFSITTAAINTTSSTVASLYKTTAANDQIVVELQKNNTLFDRLIVREEATAVYNTVDANDLLKMDNVVANIYAITPNKEHLAVHTEPSFTQAIPLGISAPIGAYQFKITGAMGASDWYLIDNYLHQQIVLNTQTSYSFDINNDAASAGESRFELAKKMWTTQVGNSAILSSLMLQSNLVQNEIRFKANPTFEKLIYKLLDTRGVLLKEGTLLDANQTIVVDQLAAGMYILQVANAEKQEVFKIVKQ